jgi:thioredoxin-like negative regulator of GroEL
MNDIELDERGILRKMAQETAGQFVLAKVNTEEVPSLATRYRITAPAIRKFIGQAQVIRK